jgi:hypothetical protein
MPSLHIAFSQGSEYTTPSYINLTFTILDPKPTATVLATCTGTWDPILGDYPTTNIACADTPGYEAKGAEFSWFLSYFVNIGEFGLKIQHSYMDERSVYDSTWCCINAKCCSVGACAIGEDGSLVYCGMSTFGERDVSVAAGDLSCEGLSCSNVFAGEAKAIEIPIVAAIA